MNTRSFQPVITAVLFISIASSVALSQDVTPSEYWKDKQTGERQERTEWHRVVLRNRLGEIAQQYLHKGSQVYIEGRIQTRKWQDQSGQDRYSTEIVGDSMTMLDSRGASSGATGGDYQSAPAPKAAPRPASPSAGPDYGAPAGGADYLDDDIPF